MKYIVYSVFMDSQSRIGKKEWGLVCAPTKEEAKRKARIKYPVLDCIKVERVD